MRGALGVWGEVGRVVAGGTLNGLSDGELLRRFGRDRDEAAFEALVARLGPMVLGVCRRELRDRRDAEDAFQATFLVLARRAGGLRDADRVGAWVYGVSRKVSRKAKAVAVRRAAREKVGDGEAEVALGLAAVTAEEDPVGDLVREAVARLPSKFREPLQLCHLEGFSHAEAAEMLQSSPDAIRGRLERARALLRERLRRIGLGPRGAEDDRALNSKSKAVVPASLIGSTVRLALQSGPRVGGALALAREVLVTMMLWNVFKTASFVVLGASLVGTGLLAGTAVEDPKGEAKAQAPAVVKEVRPPEVVRALFQEKIVMAVPEGTRVKKGEVVVRLDDSSHQDALKRVDQLAKAAANELRAALGGLELAQQSLKELMIDLDEENKVLGRQQSLAMQMITSAEKRWRRIQEAQEQFEKAKDTSPAGIRTTVELAEKESEAEIAIARAKSSYMDYEGRRQTLKRSSRAEILELKNSIFTAKTEVETLQLKRDEEQSRADENAEGLRNVINSCKLIAPNDGVVVYFKQSVPGSGDRMANPQVGLSVFPNSRVFWVWDQAAFPLSIVSDFQGPLRDPDLFPVGTKAKVWLVEGKAVEVYDAVLDKITPSAEVAKITNESRLSHFRILNPGPKLVPGKTVRLQMDGRAANTPQIQLMLPLTVEGADVGAN